MDDFELDNLTYKPPKYDYEAHNPEETFERTCIRTLMKVWVPNLSFNKLEKLFLESDLGDVLNYSWCRDRLSFSNLPVPDLTFFRVKKAWQLNLHDLLKTDIRKTEIYKAWLDQPSDGFVFPLIGSQAIIFDACSPPEFTCVIRKNKDKFIVISLLKDYATLFKEGEFYA